MGGKKKLLPLKVISCIVFSTMSLCNVSVLLLFRRFSFQLLWGQLWQQAWKVSIISVAQPQLECFYLPAPGGWGHNNMQHLLSIIKRNHLHKQSHGLSQDFTSAISAITLTGIKKSCAFCKARRLCSIKSRWGEVVFLTSLLNIDFVCQIRLFCVTEIENKTKIVRRLWRPL